MSQTSIQLNIRHAALESCEHTYLALEALRKIIEKQCRTIRHVASLLRRDAKDGAEIAQIDQWERNSLHALTEHFDPSTFRRENPYLCSEEQVRALRAFASSTALEAWLLSHRNRRMTPANVAIYASRIRLLIAMTIMQGEEWLTGYTPALDLLALECACIARINFGRNDVAMRTYSALNDLLEGTLDCDDNTFGERIGRSKGVLFAEVIAEGERMTLYEACIRKFVWAASLAINDPVACVIQWLELRLGNKAKKPDVIELLRRTFKPLGEDEKQIINTSYVKFTSAYAI